jgi:hypothetical protein
MEQRYCLELDVLMFYTVYFYVYSSGFLYFMGLSTFRISASGFIVCQIALDEMSNVLAVWRVRYTGDGCYIVIYKFI